MNIVAIVGRPNVGKSTLFNRLIGKRDAIVEDTPGVTRDRIYGKSDWNGIFFDVIDTGGFIPGSETEMEAAIREQAEIAIDEATAIVFVVDARDGVTKFDEDIAHILRQSGKPVILVVNKADNANQDNYAYEFYSLGLGDPYPISAANGRSTGDMMDKLVSHLNDSEEDEEDERLKIAVVGRPNAGKSSLINSFLGYDRLIVTDIAGTTRDAIDTAIKFQGEELVLIDTAGLRKRANIKENIEMYSVLRTQRAIERCDIGVVMLDANRGLEDQDKKIINQLEVARKGIIIVYNKWDIYEKDEKSAEDLRKQFKEEMRTVDYAPVLFASALTKQRIQKILETALVVAENRKKRIATRVLNETILPYVESTPPPSTRGRDMRINFITQVSTEPPVFALFLNYPTDLAENYKRFLERKIRENFDFEGTPISLIFRKKNKNWEERQQA
ncbi:MAG: ribosome biogenesis GTPase Der [Candidatus Kapaibacteriales bacterium]